MADITSIEKYRKKKLREYERKIEREVQEVTEEVDYRWRKERMRGMTRDEVREYLADLVVTLRHYDD